VWGRDGWGGKGNVWREARREGEVTASERDARRPVGRGEEMLRRGRKRKGSWKGEGIIGCAA